MAGVMAVDYSCAHSKTILPTICDCIPHVGPNRPAMPGPRHGEKIRSTPLGCRTTNTLTNGNGKRGCENCATTLPFFEIAGALMGLDHPTSDIGNANHRKFM